MNTTLKHITKKLCSLTLAAAMVCTVGAVGIPAAFGEEALGAKVNAAEEGIIDNYAWCENEDGVTLLRYFGNEGNIIIPSEIDGKPVTELGYQLFNYGTVYDSIVLPEGLKRIDDRALGCNVNSLTVPDSIEYIEKDAVNRSSEWYKLLPENGVIYIGKIAYGYKPARNSSRIISLKSGTTMIAYGAFERSNIIEIKLPDSVTSIGTEAFLQSSLQKINIPDSVTSIGMSAFNRCTALSEIVLPEGLGSIETHTFYGCSNLEDINIPDSVTYIGEAAFENTPWLDKQPDGVLYHNNIAYAFKGDATSVTIRDDTTMIADGTFMLSDLQEITIPDGVRYIGMNAFYNCDDLISINMPNSVEIIGNYAFYKCTKLPYIKIPQGITELGERTFYSCQCLKEAVLPDSLRTIGYACFKGCTSLELAALPEGIETIDGEAFMGCSSLGVQRDESELYRYFYVPSSLVYFSDNVFHTTSQYDSDQEWNENLTILTPENSEMQRYAEKNSLRCEIDSTKPAAVYDESIYTRCLIYSELSDGICITGMKGMLDKVIIPEKIEGKNVVGIGDNAFGGKGSLKRVILPDGLKYIGETSFASSGIEEIVFPESLEQIERCAFWYCFDLRNVIIPENVICIGERAFFECRNMNVTTVCGNDTLIGNMAIGYHFVTKTVEAENGHQLTTRESYVNSVRKNYVVCGQEGSSAKNYAADNGLVFRNTENGQEKNYRIEAESLSLVNYVIENGSRLILAGKDYRDRTYIKLIPVFDPENTTDRIVTWSSSDESVATVLEGMIRPHSYGTAVITASTENGISASCEVCYEDGEMGERSRFYIVEEPLTMNLSTKPMLSDYAGYSNIEWSSSNDTVAVVSDDGIVKAVSAGKATITGSNENGVVIMFEVTVEKPEISVKTVTLNKTRKTIGIGEQYTLKATVTPADATDKKITWTSSNSAVAAVSGGKVTAKKTGTATITARSANGKTATCLITVKKAPSRVTLNKTKKTIGVGESYTLKAALPEGTASGIMKWTTSSSAVVTVKDGVLTAKKTGTATITVKTFNGKTASCLITVKKAPSKVTLNKTTLTMKKGGTYTLKASLPSGTASGIRTWTSSDSKAVTVKDGVLTAKKAGTATITVKTFNGKTAKCKITVK